MKRIIVIVLMLSVIIGDWFWLYGSKILMRPKVATPSEINLTIWGLWDDQIIYSDVVARYRELHPNVGITYVKQNLLNYKSRVQAQVKSQTGPDIFMFENTSLPVFLDYLAPSPETVFTLSDYQAAFYPVASDSLTSKGNIYGVPAEVDGLVLYYNEDLLKRANLSPPTTWTQFSDEARILTQKDDSGQIQVAGASLGTTTNVDFWPEIIGLLFYEQPEASLTAPASLQGAEVLRFYTQFVTDPKNKTWDTNLPSSTEMFKDGKLAFYFGNSRVAASFAASGPNLHFKTALVPQILGKNVAWGSFFSYGVSKTSAHAGQAWDFLKFLTSSPSLRMIYEHQSQQNMIGQPFARVDMAGVLIDDPVVGTFIKQGPIYKTWYLNQNSQDFGINDEMISLYKGAVDSTLQGGDAQSALQSIQDGIGQILDKYKVPR